MTETVVVTEIGCDNTWTYRRCEEDGEQFELVCGDGSTKGTRSHFEDVLLDNIARRDDAIATLRADFVAHDCRGGKVVAIPWALCSACVSATERRQYTARQLVAKLATLRAQLAGVREKVETLERFGPIIEYGEARMQRGVDFCWIDRDDVLAALDGR